MERKNEIKKKNYDQGNFDGLDQVLFGIGNHIFIQLCLVIIDSKTIGVRASGISFRLCHTLR